jgi:MFS family permease
MLVGAPLCGIIADRSRSRQLPLLLGFLVLGASTVMLCLGRSITVLAIGRILQGAAAAVVWTVALALLSDTVGKERSGHALGYVALSYSIGVFVAPLLGGVIYERAGYYAVFAMTFAIIAFDLVLRLLIVEKKVAARWLKPDTPSTPGDNELTALEASAAAEAEVGKANAVVTEQTPSAKKNRKLPTMLILLKSRRIQAAFLGNFVAGISIGAFDSTLPIFVNKTFGWDSLGAGLIFIAIIVPSFAGPLIGESVFSRIHHFSDS